MNIGVTDGSLSGIFSCFSFLILQREYCLGA
jgi:hypothetical protein